MSKLILYLFLNLLLCFLNLLCLCVFMLTWRPLQYFLQCPGCLQAKDNVLSSYRIRSTFPGGSEMLLYIMGFCAEIYFSKYHLSQVQNNRENIGQRGKCPIQGDIG